MADQLPQRRRFPRYLADLEVTIYLDSKMIQSRIAQVSRGGCLVFPPLPATPSPQVKLSFRLAEDSPLINCRGEVVYSIGDRGTGIAFSEISLYNQELITEFFEKHAPAERSPTP